MPSPDPLGASQSPPGIEALGPLNRRKFLRFAGGALALSGVAGILAACGGGTTAPASSAAAPASSAAPASVAAKPSVAAGASAPTSIAASAAPASAAAGGSIKVGVLNSLSGTMAISEVA